MIRTAGLFVVAVLMTLACGNAAGSKNAASAKDPAIQAAGSDQASVPGAPSQSAALLAALDAAKARWRTNAPNAYRLLVSRRCFCAPVPPFESVVRQGTVESSKGGVPNRGQGEQESRLETVEALFAEAERSIHKADSVTLEFDPTFGYPVRIHVDWKAGWIDDEVTWLAAVTRVD